MAWSLNFFMSELFIKTLSMKRFLVIVIMILSAILILYSFRNKYQTSIVGRVNPVGSANAVWAVSGRDSTTSNVVNGAFSLEAKQGIYKVVIDGVEPYKDAILENVSVKEGQTVDVGEIMLQK
jgi:hypothetical protein